MAYTISLTATNHKFRKIGLVTQFKGKQSYDTYQCTYCEIKGKRYGLSSSLNLDGRFSKAKVFDCPNKPKEAEKVKVIKCNGFNEQFDNLTPGSVHKIIEKPEGAKTITYGVWVMGVSEPVVLVEGEFIRLH